LLSYILRLVPTRTSYRRFHDGRRQRADHSGYAGPYAWIERK
jgi:hypothetical protein